jgi:hypothetical protein
MDSLQGGVQMLFVGCATIRPLSPGHPELIAADLSWRGEKRAVVALGGFR